MQMANLHPVLGMQPGCMGKAWPGTRPLRSWENVTAVVDREELIGTVDQESKQALIKSLQRDCRETITAA